jgi:galactokinase
MSFEVRAPGRVCLFGEHSDYFSLDVIPAALDMSIIISAEPREDLLIEVNYPDLGTSDGFSIEKSIIYRDKRDYIRSVFNVLSRVGMRPEHGWNLTVTGTIPIASGLSSSSALAVAGVLAVGHMSGAKITTRNLAYYAFDAEVTEFGESGGMMDHFASAFGGLIHVEFTKAMKVTRLPAVPEGIVIGDSLEKKKDTVGDLRYIRETVERAYSEFAKKIPSFSQRHTEINRVLELSEKATSDSRRMALTTMMNRDLTRRAFEILKRKHPNPAELGEMFNEHHRYLRDGLKRSTKKIEKLIQASKDAGALGCKMNGSGGGGTMMAYAPEREIEVANAIKKAGGKPYIVKVGDGATLTMVDE